MMLQEIFSQIVETFFLAGFLFVIIISLGGRKIPPKYRKRLFVIITAVFLMGLINSDFANAVAKILLIIFGIYIGFKCLCD